MTSRTATVGTLVSTSAPFRRPVEIDVFLRLCIKSGTPLAMSAFHAAINGDYDALTSIKVDPFFYSWNQRYAELELDYQIAAFFKKYQDFDLGINLEEVAYGKWIKAEQSCKRINSIFRLRWEGNSPPFSFHVEEAIHLARRKITEILGTVGPRELDWIRHYCRHGPGGDLDLAKRNASAYEKYRSLGSITSACVSLYDQIFGSADPDCRQDYAHHALLVEHSKLSFVPKTARTHRAICIEPRWNIYLQLGIGSLIEKRLKRVGLDITDQTKNQQAACNAYSNGLGTIDLSSASDTISTNLVIDLLSCADPMWLELILKARCHYTMYKNQRIRLEKISSMGNGYTFPLETLIFYALSWASAKLSGSNTRDVLAYGDDIIVPRAAFSQTVEVLEAVGFSVNTDKSYASGDFYESCGKDYFRGREVRPFFVKKKVTSLFDHMVLYNQIVDWAGRNLEKGYYWSGRWSLAKLVITRVPKHQRYYGPTTLSGVFHAPFDQWCPKRARFGIEGYWVKCLVTKQERSLKYGYYGHLYSKLSGVKEMGNWVITPSDPVFRLKDVLVPFSQDFILHEVPDLGSSSFR